MTDPNADLADIRQHWLRFCSHDAAADVLPCICPTEDHRPVIAALVGEVETLRAEVARLEVTAFEDGDLARVVLAAVCDRCARLEGDKAKLLQTIEAFPDANDAANLAHARAERDQLRADVAQLTTERDEAIRVAAERVLEARQALTERDEAQALLRLAPHHQQQVVTLEYELVQARAEVERYRIERRDAARDAGRLIREKRAVETERDAMRTVVEAAVAYRANAASELSWPYRAERASELREALYAAVDQMASSTPPSTPESDGQVEVAVTDAVEASEGSSALDDAMASVWLHGDWRWLTRNMTTEEKTAAADAVDRHYKAIKDDDEVSASRVERWWLDA